MKSTRLLTRAKQIIADNFGIEVKYCETPEGPGLRFRKTTTKTRASSMLTSLRLTLGEGMQDLKYTKRLVGLVPRTRATVTEWEITIIDAPNKKIRTRPDTAGKQIPGTPVIGRIPRPGGGRSLP